jgi:hypothetical protein
MLPAMAVAKKVLEQALELSEEERCDLISQLMASIEDERDEAPLCQGSCRMTLAA